MPKKPTESIDPERRAAASLMGKKGGASGRGAAKRRSPEFYKVTLKEARERARAKRLAQKV